MRRPSAGDRHEVRLGALPADRMTLWIRSEQYDSSDDTPSTTAGGQR